MKLIPLIAVMILIITTASAEGLATSTNDKEACGDGKPNVDVQTRYGMVRYQRSVVQIDGKIVQTDELTTRDSIWFKKLFKMGEEDVLLSTGMYMGNTSDEMNQDFLLVLGPGKAPQVILIPGDSACPMWQQGNALYIGGGEDECGNKLPIIKFDHDKFSPSKMISPNCVRKPHVVEEHDCKEEFEMVKSVCSSISTEKCATDANTENAAGYGALSQMTWLNSVTREPYFNAHGFNKLCLAWCKGKEVPYSAYQKSLCMAR